MRYTFVLESQTLEVDEEYIPSISSSVQLAITLNLEFEFLRLKEKILRLNKNDIFLLYEQMKKVEKKPQSIMESIEEDMRTSPPFIEDARKYICTNRTINAIRCYRWATLCTLRHAKLAVDHLKNISSHEFLYLKTIPEWEGIEEKIQKLTVDHPKILSCCRRLIQKNLIEESIQFYRQHTETPYKDAFSIIKFLERDH